MEIIAIVVIVTIVAYLIIIPNGTYIAKSSRVADVLQSILTENKAVKYTNMHEVISALGEAVQNGSNREIRRQHIMTVRKQRFG